MAITEGYTPPNGLVVHIVDAFLDHREMPDIVHLMQYDDRMPIVEAHLYAGGQPYRVPDGASVNIRMKKPDGKGVYNPAIGISSDRCVVYVAITLQMTAAYGDGDAIIELSTDSGVIGTAAIRLSIDKNPVQDGQLESTDEYKTIQELVNEAIKSAELSGGASEAAENAAKVASEAASSAQEAAQNASEAENNSKQYAEDAKQAKEDAESAKTAIENMTVEATTLDDSEPASVEKSVIGDVLHLLFGLPRGAKGDRGNGIASFERTGGTGAAGTVDTYTLTDTDGNEYELRVRNGNNGEGSVVSVSGVQADENGDVPLIIGGNGAPSGNAQEHQLYFDASAKSLYYYTGEKWETVSSGGGGGEGITVDTELDSGSPNPISNAAVTGAINKLSGSIPTSTSELDNDSGYITENDIPDVSAFVTAEQAAKAAPVQSVNGATGAVTKRQLGCIAIDGSVPSIVTDAIDLDNFYSGVALCWPSVQHLPASAWYVVIAAGDGTTTFQFALRLFNDAAPLIRRRAAGEWGAWSPLYGYGGGTTFVTEPVTVTKNFPASNVQNVTWDVTKEGYTPIGVVGFSSSADFKYWTTVSLEGTTVTASIRNTSSSASNNTSLTVNILYRKD